MCGVRTAGQSRRCPALQRLPSRKCGSSCFRGGLSTACLWFSGLSAEHGLTLACQVYSINSAATMAAWALASC